MRITSDGNVGIGGNPTNKFTILTGSTNLSAQLDGSTAYWGTYSNHSLAFATNGAERMRLDTSGNLQFNSGYGSVATAYGCRAWVNFDGTSTTANVTGTYSQTGTTVTVTITAHGYTTGQSAYLDFTSGTAVDGTYTVTVTDANTFTVTQASRTTSGNVTSRRNTIRGSGNVSSVSDNATGDYTVNFTTAMPDVNYSVAFGGTRPTTNYFLAGASSFATTSVLINTWSTVPAAVDYPTVCVSIFR
jgi:hypothetical protein